MEPNVDRGMWSVVVLLAAIVIGGVALIAFPKISGKIVNNMDETVSKAFSGETPSWIEGSREHVITYGPKISHKEKMLSSMYAFHADKQDSKVEKVKVNGVEGMRVTYGGKEYSYSIKGTFHVAGLEKLLMYRSRFYVINNSDSVVTLNNDGGQTVGFDGKAGNKVVIPAKYEGYVDLDWIPKNNGVHFHFRMRKDTGKMDLIILDAYSRVIESGIEYPEELKWG